MCVVVEKVLSLVQRAGGEHKYDHRDHLHVNLELSVPICTTIVQTKETLEGADAGQCYGEPCHGADDPRGHEANAEHPQETDEPYLVDQWVDGTSEMRHTPVVDLLPETQFRFLLTGQRRTISLLVSTKRSVEPVGQEAHSQDTDGRPIQIELEQTDPHEGKGATEDCDPVCCRRVEQHPDRYRDSFHVFLFLGSLFIMRTMTCP